MSKQWSSRSGRVNRTAARARLPLFLQRTPDAPPALVQDVSVDHRGGYIGVSHKFLDRADVVAAFEEMCRKAVPQRVTTARLFHPRRPDGPFHRLLQGSLRDVVALLPA